MKRKRPDPKATTVARPVAERSLRRMEASLRAEIRHYEQCLPLLETLPPEVFLAGKELFADEGQLALWLCEPARALGGRVPLRHLSTAAERRRVVRILEAITHGTIL